MVSRQRPMPDEIRSQIDDCLAFASARDTSNGEVWSTLEDAHVLSQPWAWTHVRVHWVMLKVAWRSKDLREVLGQLTRLLLAAPGSLSGRYPTGNTGRARVSAFEPMPIRGDLTALLVSTGDDEGKKRPSR